MRLRVILAAMVLTLGTSIAIPVFATPANAATCYWHSGQWGNSSNCDGVSTTYCYNIYQDQIWADYVDFSVSGRTLQLFLLYSPGCRTVWASGFTSPAAPSGSNCYIKLTRNSDGQTYRHTLVGYPWGATTPGLYDADVTSYAYMYCNIGGRVYQARTRNY